VRISPGIDELQWRRPALVGDRLRLDGEVLDTRASSNPRRGFVKFRVELRRGEERVMMFVCSVMFKRRASPSSA
jgi:acyl dehydratase